MNDNKELHCPENLTELLDGLENRSIFIECDSGKEKDKLIEYLIANGMEIGSPTIDNYRRHTPDMDYPIVGLLGLNGNIVSYGPAVKSGWDYESRLFMPYSDAARLFEAPLDFDIGEVSNTDFDQAFSALIGGDGNG